MQLQQIETYLMPHEHTYPPIEKTLVAATRFLTRRCDASACGASVIDGQGFNKIDGSFGKSLTSQADNGKRWSIAQLEIMAKMLRKYSTQLLLGGITLPNEIDVNLYITSLKQPATQKPQATTHAKIDLRNKRLYIYIPYEQDAKRHELRDDVYGRWKKGEAGFKSALTWAANNAKEWEVTATEEALLLMLSNKYFPKAELTPAAYALKKQHEAKEAAALRLKVEEDKKTKKIYADILKTVGLQGDENPEVAPGIHLMRHQRQAVRFIVWKRRCIIADQVGLGKTFEALVAAKAFFNYYGWKIIICTTKSMVRQWVRDVARFGLSAHVYTWDTLPEPQASWGEYVFIADEVQFAKTALTKRAKAMKALAMHPNCQSFIPMTGTPLDNARPREAYNILLCCKNPNVYSANAKEQAQKKLWYEKTFCGRHKEIINGREITKTDGSTNLHMWHKLFVYKFEHKDENDPNACILARRKKDVDEKDMPACYMYPREADIDDEQIDLFHCRLQQAVESFQETIKKGIEKFIEEYKLQNDGAYPSAFEIDQQKTAIKNAEKLVMLLKARQAASLAKLPWILGEIEALLDDGEKVVIGTSFKTVAKEVATAINKKYGKNTAYVIDGDKSEKVRDEQIQDFQNPEGVSRVMIITEAGAAGITLTAACYFLSLDRPWTPGKYAQQTGRINRKGQTRPVTIIVARIPSYITSAEAHTDEIIERKEVGVNIALYDEEQGMVYGEDLNSKAEEYVYDMLEDVRKFKSIGAQV